ncbi:unnamed protein product [Caenorhabditis angaria]|uniref:PD-(D/E)XK endonuclease-like domain-containing protein n=1 Tax=Caenorhabditis angaria TaxID=860376 RepID=A0A9P1N3Q7_9PELO|nr:unnamed protein product [Caenorhabditis angaria]
MAKCNIRYGTSLAPTFAKNLDKIAPKNVENVKLLADSRVKLTDVEAKLRRPSVSAILGAMGEKRGLFLWQKAMIEEMGLAGFRKTMAERLEVGIKIHSHIENLVKLRAAQNFAEKSIFAYIDAEKEQNLRNYMRSALPFIFELGNSAGNVILEGKVRHPVLGYTGRFDAILADSKEILDWKTSPARSTFSTQRLESLSYTNYVRQLSAYTSAFNHDTNFENSNFSVKSAILVSLKENGEEAEIFRIPQNELESAFENFKRDLSEFWREIEATTGTNVDFAYKPEQ